MDEGGAAGIWSSVEGLVGLIRFGPLLLLRQPSATACFRPAALECDDVVDDIARAGTRSLFKSPETRVLVRNVVRAAVERRMRPLASRSHELQYLDRPA